MHFRGKCYRVDDVVCEVPTESKWNKTQPNLVMQGWAKSLDIENNVAKIS